VASDVESENGFGGLAGQTVWYDCLPGESMGFLVTAGHNGNLCQARAAGPFVPGAPEFQAQTAQQKASAQYVWDIDVRMIDVQASSTTFELSWQRTSRASPDERLQYSRRLSL